MSDDVEGDDALDEREPTSDPDGDPDWADIFAPPGDDDYEQIKYFKGLEVLPKSFRPFESLTRGLMRRGDFAFAVRFARTGSHSTGLDPEFFTQRVLRAARLNRWVSNAAYRGAPAPGLLATLPGSLIAHFTVSDGEVPARLGRHTEYPTVAGSRGVARLLAYSGDRDALLEAIRPLGKRAVNTLVGTLEDSVELDLTMNWVTREGMYTRLAPKAAEKGVETLDIVPHMITKRGVPILGALDRPDHEKSLVKLQPVTGAPIILHFPPALEDGIRGAWGKYIAGTMTVAEPENPSLPRAPRRIRTLTRIDHVYETASQLPPAGSRR